MGIPACEPHPDTLIIKDDYRQQIAEKLALLSVAVGSKYGPNSGQVEVEKDVA
ncbi:MAG TPA: hypothetical protein VEJ45_01950 [Candidatus Acidoferrales bacterium]|nr:hypothetical protein [Candidatus Acidoferrales bacterium]